MGLAKHECPWCVFHSAFLRGLLRHIFREHGAEEVLGRRKALRVVSDCFECWCGGRFRLHQRPGKRSQLERHLMLEAGIVAHLLGVALRRGEGR